MPPKASVRILYNTLANETKGLAKKKIKGKYPVLMLDEGRKILLIHYNKFGDNLVCREENNLISITGTRPDLGEHGRGLEDLGLFSRGKATLCISRRLEAYEVIPPFKTRWYIQRKTQEKIKKKRAAQKLLDQKEKT